MSTLFDTLRVTKDLQSSGFDTRQSEGIVAALEISLDSAVATKADIAAVRSEIAQLKTELKADNGTLRSELKAEIDTLRTELKAEIDTLRTELKAEIDTLRTELKAEIDTLRTELKAGTETLRTEVKAEIHAQANKTILAVIAVAAVVLAAIKLL